MKESNTSEILTAALQASGRIDLEWETGLEKIAIERARLEKNLYEAYCKNPAAALLMLGLVDAAVRFHPSLEFWHTICSRFVHLVLTHPQLETERERLCIDLEADDCREWLEDAPPMVGREYLSFALIQNMWDNCHRGLAGALKKKGKAAEEILRALAPASDLLDHRIHFHLVENRTDPERPFAFVATYATKDSSGRSRHLPLKLALQELAGDDKKLLALLSSVHRVAEKSALVRSFLDSGEIFEALSLSPKEAHQFLSEVPEYEKQGVLCRIPRWWPGRASKPTATLTIGSASGPRMTADTLLECKAALMIGDEEISELEARRILSEHLGLALIKNRWVVVDSESLAKQLELFQQARASAKNLRMSLPEAMRMLLGAAQTEAFELPVPVSAGPALADFLERLSDPSRLKEVAVPAALQASLRPYQKAGLYWLAFLFELRLGGCLADDMGLGKTIQVLAFLLHLKERKPAPQKQKKARKKPTPSLLIVPSSLVFNWIREAEKFAPALKIVVLHRRFAKKGNLTAVKKEAQKADLVITTYGMLRLLPDLSRTSWHCLILDEAQAIKTPGTGQTRAVKSIEAQFKIALTGTPVENRLGDLWSLFDFLQHGLLGTAQKFKRFASELTKSGEYGRLRQVVGPYILRRLKTDKSIIKDLPDKVSMKVFAILSPDQRVLYAHLAGELAHLLEVTEPQKRRMLVLTYLMKFKQVCNHPDHYSGGDIFSEKSSGKFLRLREICEELHEKRERVLIFTQFREMIAPLDRFLSGIFQRPGVQLHGASSMKARREAVDLFQGPEYVPYFLLSIKAGGTGLNLTAARHVVHFDRWWNPAVERQAEDRAYRIGQQNKVVVHKFVSQGTVEERIDEIIEAKQELAENILSANGEKWITEMTNAELRNLFALRDSV